MRAVQAVSFVYLKARGLEYLAGARVVGARVDDVTKEFAGLAPSVAALGLDRSVAGGKGKLCCAARRSKPKPGPPPLPCFPAANQTSLSFLAPHLKR